MTDINPHLFVYGSLLTAERNAMGERLRTEATLVGAATFAGRLYQVSWYPGVIANSAAGDIVHGEVYRLGAPPATLVWLDGYEGVNTDATSVAECGEYIRVEAAVTVAGAALTCWIYLYNRDVAGLTPVPSGHWADRENRMLG